MSSTNRGAERRAADFYPTPSWVTRALLRHVARTETRGDVYDPCAGDGAILSVAKDAGWTPLATEIRPECRFVLETLCGPGCTYILDAISVRWFPSAPVITNPPFPLAREFISTFRKGRPFAAFLVPGGFIGAVERASWWRAWPPSELLVLPRRPAFVAVCKGRAASKKAGTSAVKGCGELYPIGTRGRCRCGGTVADGTDSVVYWWAVWRDGPARPSHGETRVAWLDVEPDRRAA